MSIDEERPYQVEKTECSSCYKLDLWETALTAKDRWLRAV